MTKLFPNRAARRAADAAARKQGATPDAPEDDTDEDMPVSTKADGPADDKDDPNDADADDDDDSDPDMSDDEGDDTDEDSEMRGKTAVAAARGRERARCAAIFEAAGPHQTALAVHAAFHTKMSRDEAIAMLKKAPAGAPAANNGRASRNPTIGVPAATNPGGRIAASSGWDRSIERANAKR